MKTTIAIGCQHNVAAFMEYHLHTHGAFHPEIGTAFATVDMSDNAPPDIRGAVWFDGFNGANMFIHVAAVPGARWLNRTLLRVVFQYAFVQCGCKRLTGLVAASNHVAKRFDEHIGFKLEATLKDAAPDGDLLVYVMRREDCRWLTQLGVSPFKLGVH